MTIVDLKKNLTRHSSAIKHSNKWWTDDKNKNYQKTHGYVNKNSSYLRRNLLSLKTIKIVLKQIIFSTQHRPYRKEFDSIGNFNCESNS